MLYLFKEKVKWDRDTGLPEATRPWYHVTVCFDSAREQELLAGLLRGKTLKETVKLLSRNESPAQSGTGKKEEVKDGD